MRDKQAEIRMIGMQAMLPGMLHLLDVLTEFVEDFKAQVAALDGTGARRKGGRPPGKSNKANSYWANLTPAQRSAEMKRRAAVTRGEVASAKQKQSAARKAYWAAMTPKQRRAEMKRRGMVRKDKAPWNKGLKTSTLSAMDPRSPKHAAWREKENERKRKWAAEKKKALLHVQSVNSLEATA